MQYDYKYSMNGWSKVITEVQFNCTAAMQGAHHISSQRLNHSSVNSENIEHIIEPYISYLVSHWIHQSIHLSITWSMIQILKSFIIKLIQLGNARFNK